MKEKLLQYGLFNVWANERIVSIFEHCDTGLLEKEIVNSFPSIRKTVLHINGAEHIWLGRLQGVSGVFESDDSLRSMKDIFAAFVKTSINFAEFVKAQPEDFFEKRLSFKTTYAGATSNIAYDMIHHCINHSTYHRGQLVTMARQIGMEKIPPLDQIFYIRELEKAKTW